MYFNDNFNVDLTYKVELFFWIEGVQSSHPQCSHVKVEIVWPFSRWSTCSLAWSERSVLYLNSVVSLLIGIAMPRKRKAHPFPHVNGANCLQQRRIQVVK